MTSHSCVQVVSRKGNRIKFEVDIELSGSLLDTEDVILASCNELGCLATKAGLEWHDTDGSALELSGIKWTSRARVNKQYHTPYGKVDVKRHVYQTSKGGRIYCPLETSARIIERATPRMAKLLSSKYARLNANETRSDLEDNHGCRVSVCYLQKVADAVGTIAQAKEEDWDYRTPHVEDAVGTVSLSLDGAMVPMRDGGWRESMVGSISLYDLEGERLHSIYLGASPEYGKASFKKRFIAEAERVAHLYPKARRVGIADGAVDNWSLLTPFTQHQVLDFYHASEYLTDAADGAYPEKTGKPKRQKWLQKQCHKLKQEPGGAEAVLKELKRVERKHLANNVKEKVKEAIRYFTNHLSMMDYASYVRQGLPIGSGVTEAACKTLVKQRLCRSGMRWKDQGLKTVLSLRALLLTPDRWKQFWQNINRYDSILA